jgi:hypothetical protein
MATASRGNGSAAPIVRWRPVDPGDQVGPSPKTALPAVLALVVIPAVVFVVELPIALVRALLSRRGRGKLPALDV